MCPLLNFVTVVGKSRSVSVVLAYLVAVCDVSLADAWAGVRAARPSAQPHASFWRQLQSLELCVRGSVSLSLVDALRDCSVESDVRAWLDANATLVHDDALATHVWQTALTAERFAVPPGRTAELCALASLADATTQLRRADATSTDDCDVSLDAGRAILAAARGADPALERLVVAADNSDGDELAQADDTTPAQPDALLAFVRRRGLERLEHDFGLKIKRHEQHRSLVCVSYSAAANDFSLPLVNQSRGIILDRCASGFVLFALPFFLSQTLDSQF